MKNYHKLTAILFALAFTAVFIFAESPADKEKAAPAEYKQKLEQVKIKFFDLFHPVESDCVQNDNGLLWNGSRGFERYDLNYYLIHVHMAGITNLVSAKKYLSLVETAQPLKGAYVLTFWAPELLFQLPYEEVIDYYAALQDKNIPVPKIICEKIEEEHKNDPAFWNYNLSKIDRDIYVKTNKVSIASELLRDFDKTFPKEERKAKEKCVGARFVKLLEGPEKAADYLLKEIAGELDPNERQTLYLQAVSFNPNRDFKKKILEMLSADQDIPDPVLILSRCGSIFYLDASVAQLWERALCAKDPRSALAAWEVFVSHYWYILKPDRDVKTLFKVELQDERATRTRKLKDIFLDYLKSEAPFKEADFFQLLSEEELQEERKQTGREYIAYGFDQIISGRKKKLLFIMLVLDRKEELLAYGKRRAEKLAELENRFSAEDGSKGENAQEWNDFWHIYRDEAKRYGFMPLYKETLRAYIEKYPEKFQFVKNYCEVLYKEGQKKEAENFLSKYYPEEKLINHPEELQSYAELHKYHELPFDEKSTVKKIFEFGLQNDAEELAEGNQYLWERLWKGDNRDVRKEVREKIAALPKLGPSLLKRLKEISVKEDYEAILAGKRTESDSAENPDETQNKDKGNAKEKIAESEKSDDTVISGEWGLYYPKEVKKRYEACKQANDPEKERWALELALLNGRFTFDDIVEKLPKAWNEKRPLQAFQQSVWYLENTEMYLPGLSFLLKHFAKEERIPEERWLMVFESTEHHMGSATNVFVRHKSRFPFDFLNKLNGVRPIFSDHRTENAISAFYLKILTDKYTGKREPYSDVYSLLEDSYLDVYETRCITRSSLQYLFAIFVDSRTNDLIAALDGAIDLMRLCEDSHIFDFDYLALYLSKRVQNITLNAETDEGKTTVGLYLSIYERLFGMVEAKKNSAYTTLFQGMLRSALEQAFRAFAKADRYDEYWHYLKEDLKHFKGSEDLIPFISICGDIKKNRAFVLDMFIYFLLDFSSEEMAVLRGAPNYETLSKHFALGDAEEELKKVDVDERTYTNVMQKILNAAVARNDSNEVKRITWQLETYSKICKERLESRKKEIEERHKRLEEEEEEFSPFSSWDGRLEYRKKIYRDKELSREKEGEDPRATPSFFDEENWLTGNTLEDWNGKRKYLEKKWKEEAEKAKNEEDENAGNVGEE